MNKIIDKGPPTRKNFLRKQRNSAIRLWILSIAYVLFLVWIAVAANPPVPWGFDF